MPQSRLYLAAGAVLTLAIAAGGCGRSEQPTPAASANAGPVPAPAAVEEAPDAAALHSIDWHDGDVNSAFARAADENKPLFLYWGAEWCPPCNQIKATIFSRPEFVEKSRLFVPVYLDGDTAGAQALGDRFGVMGYPTMIVFDSTGQEVTRIPGGLDIELYANVLDLTLADVRPVADALEAVVASRPVTDDDYRLLAYYSWTQDNERVLAGRDALATYRTLAEACPDRLAAESSRLYVAYLSAALAAARDEDDPRPLAPAQKAEALDRVGAILEDPGLARANLIAVLYGADTIVGGLTDPGSDERAQLEGLWQRRLDALAKDDSVSLAHRLATVLTRIRLAKLDDPEASVPAALRQLAGERVAWADAAAQTPYQRQAVINTAWYVLSEAGLDEEATTLLAAELEKSRQPYYFMLDLADLAKKAGREEEALAWLERAYRESQGPATRFQWGYNYVVGLLEMAPGQGDRIETATIEVLGELDGPNNAIYNRTARTLGRMGDSLTAWNAEDENSAHIERIRDRAAAICESIPAADTARQTCDRFLAVTCGEAPPGTPAGAPDGAAPERC